MKFVADESCAGSVTRALREAGHEVLAVAEAAMGSPDDKVLEFALREERVPLPRITILANWSMHAGIRQRA